MSDASARVTPSFLHELRMRLIDLPRHPKRMFLITNDFLLLSLALWLALSLRYNMPYVPANRSLAVVLALAPSISVLTFHMMGLYRLVTRFISARGTARIFAAVGFSVMLWGMVVLFSGVQTVPRSVIAMYGVLGAFFVWASRQFAGFLLKGLPNVRFASFDDVERKRVAIYGAGAMGVQLLEALKRSKDYAAVGFIDDNPTLWGQLVGGLKVYRPEKIDKLIERDGIEEVLLAMSESDRQARRDVIRLLTRYPLRVRMLPAMEDIASGRVRVSDLRNVEATDLLGRDPVPPDPVLLTSSVRGKVVMVTGAGGSIGSELARQIIKLKPAELVILDVSEPALYHIEQELIEQVRARRAHDSAFVAPELIAVLGSVQDEALMRATISRHRVQTIYHAAAYKHVPIVEHNAAAGLLNNTFGTQALAQAARACGVELFVLISTDKAVRPTNIMGASKRLAELVLQAHASEEECETIFTMVRFGNVLDSSGSVVKLFRKQIEAGGPVTVTHRDVLRYFMSIPEAAELVIQAGAMARGGDVFVLDMGDAVKVDDLAREMIRLMGLEVQDEEHPEGDIAIEYIGLRPGEKLHEELLISANTTETEHPRIARCNEPGLTRAQLAVELQTLTVAMSSDRVQDIHGVLQRTVEGYIPDTRHLEAISWPVMTRTLH